MSGSCPERSTVSLTHAKVTLALHQLREGSGRPLLLLHGLGEESPREVPRYASAWPGPIWALDFTGHGGSSLPLGGGYTAEVLMADADRALAHVGQVTVLGRGLGAYVALLIAGGRPTEVRGAILIDGPGAAGGGPAPHSPFVVSGSSHPGAGQPASTPDPFALVELANDIRPADYATTFARLAVQFSEMETPIAVAGVVRPPWLAAVIEEPGVVVTTIPDALARFAAIQ